MKVRIPSLLDLGLSFQQLPEKSVKGIINYFWMQYIFIIYKKRWEFF
jgi:hypothetical protein